MLRSMKIVVLFTEKRTTGRKQGDPPKEYMRAFPLCSIVNEMKDHGEAIKLQWPVTENGDARTGIAGFMYFKI